MPEPNAHSKLPASYSEENLRRNLAALDRKDPRLAERIRWPVDDRRVEFDEQGRMLYRGPRLRFPVAVGEGELASLLGDVGQAPTLILGIGCGDLLDGVLARRCEHVVAWERDPWILRLDLLRRDRSREIREGRLRYALGVDLVGYAPAAYQVLEHPVMRHVYPNEIRVFRAGLGSRRVGLCAGGLFVDQVGRVMDGRGLSAWTLDLENLSQEELALSVEKLRPEFLFAINYTRGLADFASRQGVPVIVWEVDPTTAPPHAESDTSLTFLFTYRKQNVELYRRAGFEHVQYLPLAADPDSRTALEVEDRVGVSFVGSSLLDTGQRLRERFLQMWNTWRCGDAAAREEGQGLFARILAAQRADPSRFAIDGLLRREAPEFLECYLSGGLGVEDPAILISELAASEKRLSYVANLGTWDMHVWGDPGWKAIEKYGVNYRGYAGHHRELNRIYSASGINLDIGRLYQSDIVTMRVYDILSCGGFVLAEHSDTLAEIFAVGVELDTYRNVGELKAKVEHYLAHPQLARALAEEGQRVVHEKHTIESRLGVMFDVMARSLAPAAKAGEPSVPDQDA